LDGVYVRRGDQPFGRRRLTRAVRLLVRVAALVHVTTVG
jgi:hypothetical protein